MAYVEAGSGAPMVFIHGNPTSSYLWRNVMPHLEAEARVIAPDLIGMGDSDKLPDSGPDRYTFVEHREYLDELLDKLGVTENVTLVGQDWGSALAFDWAMRHVEATRGIVHMESIVMGQSTAEMPKARRQYVLAFRGPEGEEMMINGKENSVVERSLTEFVLRALTDEEKTEYRRPYLNPGEDRRPTLSWARQQVMDGEPREVAEIIAAYGEWLGRTDIPKLLIDADPGGLLSGERLEFARTWPNQKEVRVKGLHNIQEDSPDEIGAAISAWYSNF